MNEGDTRSVEGSGVDGPIEESKIDKHGRLDEEIFSYRQSKQGLVMLYWYDKHVKTLAGAQAEKFLKQIERAEGKAAQLVMAKVTGNFKRGNERRTSR